MNNRGQAVFAGIMIAIMVFIVAVIMIQPLVDFTSYARDTEHLACDYTNLSVGIRMTCILIDVQVFYITGMAIAAGVAFIGGKWALQRL